MARGLQKLSRKHKLFCQYYIQSFNATQSALKAGAKESNAYDTGWKWLQEDVIKAYIAELFRKVEMKPEEIKGIVSSLARDTDDKTNCLRANELMSKIHGLVKTGNTNVAVSVGSEGRLSDIMSRRFGGLVENEAGQ